MLHLSINQTDGVPIYRQLTQQITHLIASGRLTPETEMPSVRALAQQLLVNPNTVVRAYRELEAAGLLYKRQGAGAYVATQTATPYTEEECRRLLSERAEALLMEGWRLGYDVERIIELVWECNENLWGQGGAHNEEESS